MWTQKMKSGRYQFFERYEDPMTGKKKTVSVSFDKDTASTRKMALEALQAKIREATEDTLKPTDITLKGVYEAYKESAGVSLKPTSFSRNLISLRKTLEILGADTLASRLTARYIVDKFDRSGLQNVTKNEKIKIFKAMMRWASKNEIVGQVDYLKNISRFQDDKKSRISDKYMELAELKKLLDEAPYDKYKDVVLFMVLSGLRVGEMIALNADDVNLATKTINVDKTYVLNTGDIQSTKTESSCREVYIQTELFDVCKRLMGQKYFVEDSPGHRLNYYAFNKWLKYNTQKILGRRLTTHALRHSHASYLSSTGNIPLDLISRRLGHSNSKITKEIYVHVLEEQKKRELNLLDNVNLINAM